MNIEKRLSKIEAVVESIAEPPVDEAEGARWLECCGAILSTMREDHQQLVLGEGERRAATGAVDPALSNLFKNFLYLARLKFYGTSDQLALPPEFVELYLADPLACPLSECVGCGLKVPLKHDWKVGAHGGRESIYSHVFDNCPLCGGKAVYNGNYYRLRAEAA